MSSGTHGTLFVRNVAQQTLFKLELAGQLSDGAWENSTPSDHWEPWCDCDVRVAEPNQRVGRDFYARRTNYNFGRKDLLDVVAKRMLGKVRIARVFGFIVAQELQWEVRCEDGLIDFECSTYPKRDAYWDEKRDRLKKYAWKNIDNALRDETYDMKELKRDLRELNAIVKIDVRGSWTTGD